MVHLDGEVNKAIVRLADALCTYERATGRESILVLREQGGFVFRAVNGKPGVPDDVPDTDLFKLIES